MSVAIRRATADDLEVLRVLLRDTWHATYDELYGPEEVERLTAGWHSIEAMEQRLRRPEAHFPVAEREGAIVGMGFAAEEEPGVLFLHQLYVLPAEQRHGVGTALLASAIEAFPAVDRVRLDVEAANRPAVEFYEKHGFAALGLEAETTVPRMMRMERLLAERRVSVGGQSGDATP
ncbi:GNAT family N-acetyltransferase [Aureimonas leprariae]|uniref:GNAT family N-acetyltransferase n=1 Tax=Plantimonas leprariae TaxID=2615207 RepID=A0A7V7PRY1_9HYPH|nr:GNAT family N-acetyltransferase [Aureimonas leprariae]KAB0681828.1 GNAT family N-acetyltransferase [Aureimonas leprariae]